MTRHRSRKKAVRAHAAATRRRYTDAATHLRLVPAAAPRMAEDLHAALSSEFRARGWPVTRPREMYLAITLYAGPVEVDIRRDRDSLRKDALTNHPDDPSCFDPSWPLVVETTAPHYADMHGKPLRSWGMDEVKIPSDWPADRMVELVDRSVRGARRLDISRIPLPGRCSVCGDHYAPTGLLDPADSPVITCPCCVFHFEVPGADPVGLAAQLDERLRDCLSLPAGWSAVQVLLACLGGAALTDAVRAELDPVAGRAEPLAQWADPGAAWIWLPPAERCPAAFARFRTLASLADLIAEIDRYHPDLRETVHAGARRYTPYLNAQAGVYRTLAETVDRLWPAVVAYSVSLLTQHAERPQHRSPWHALDPMDLRAWVKSLDRSLNHVMVETVMNEGILTVAHALTSDDRAGSDTPDRR